MPLGIRVDVLLNLVWFALGASAAVLLARSEFHTRHDTVRNRLRRLTAVLAFALALFPMVSASDDELSFSLFQATGGRGGVGVPTEDKEREVQNLVRLFDVLDAFQVQAVWTLVVTLAFFSLLAVTFISRRERVLLSLPGRAPPATA